MIISVSAIVGGSGHWVAMTCVSVRSWSRRCQATPSGETCASMQYGSRPAGVAGATVE
jgi:hypothetical protein